MVREIQTVPLHEQGEEGLKYLFTTGRHIYFCSLCLGVSTCHLQKLLSFVLPLHFSQLAG